MLALTKATDRPLDDLAFIVDKLVQDEDIYKKKKIGAHIFVGGLVQIGLARNVASKRNFLVQSNQVKLIATTLKKMLLLFSNQ